jgi:DegV family protein with EDD domain
MSIKIVADSTCDIPQAVALQYGITVVPCYFNIGNESYLDGIEMPRARFYEILPSLPLPPTTSAPSIEKFTEVYNRIHLEGATKIISIHIAGSLSNTLNAAKLAAKSITKIPVTVVDTGQLSLGAGRLAVIAAIEAAAGKSAEHIINLLQHLAARTYTLAVLDTLTYLRRSGRVSHLKYGIGTILSIKPLVRIHQGILEFEMIRTQQKALQRLYNIASDLSPIAYHDYLHAHAIEKLDHLRTHFDSLLSNSSDPFISEVTPAIGTHVGPGAIGICLVQR